MIISKLLETTTTSFSMTSFGGTKDNAISIGIEDIKFSPEPNAVDIDGVDAGVTTLSHHFRLDISVRTVVIGEDETIAKVTSSTKISTLNSFLIAVGPDAEYDPVAAPPEDAILAAITETAGKLRTMFTAAMSTTGDPFILGVPIIDAPALYSTFLEKKKQDESDVDVDYAGDVEPGTE